MGEGEVISLGLMDGPLDLTVWDRHCIANLGRIVPLGQYLSPKDWDRLGYYRCAEAKIWPGKKL